MRQSSLIFSFISFTAIFNASEPKFQKSWEDEFCVMAEHFLDPSIETLEDVKNQILADKFASKKRHYADQLRSIDNVDNEQYVLPFSDIKKTFEYLKNKMKIPSEVDCIFCVNQDLSSKALMGYAFFDRTLYMYPNYFNDCPSFQLFTMIHELTHTQQHMREGLLQRFLATQDKVSCSKDENEADTNAAELIKCPLCMKAVVACQLLKERSASFQEIESVKAHGYLMSTDLKEFLQKKSLNDLCKVHKLVENLDVSSGLDTQEGLEEICKQDCVYQSMIDRLT